MRIGLLSDIHANLEALTACLEHARTQQVDRFIFLGDYVGYGADAGEVVSIIERHARDGAIVIKGNHDEAIVKNASYMNDATRASIDWARTQLNPGQRTFLEQLPLCVRDGDLCLVHATADAPERWNYVDSGTAAAKSVGAASTPYTFSGHVHDQRLFFEQGSRKMVPFRPLPGGVIPVRRHRRWLGLVGSVGQPRDGNPLAAYSVFDADHEQLTFFRVPYDYMRAAEKIRACGLPHSLAYRLEAGA